MNNLLLSLFRKNVLRLSFLFVALVSMSSVGFGQTTYTLCTSTADLTVGSKYIIASAQTTSAVCASYQNTNNRPQSSSQTITSSSITVTPATLNSQTTTPFEFTLGGTTGAWTLYDAVNSIFINAVSGQNYLKSSAGTWAISFSSNAAVFTSSIESRLLRYNSASSLFGSYTSGQAAVYLYKAAAGASTNYYLTSGADPSVNTNWGTVSGGSGTNPSAMNIGNAIWNVTESSNTPTSNWTNTWSVASSSSILVKAGTTFNIAGTLSMGGAQISAASGATATINATANGTIQTTNTAGLSGTTSTTISSANTPTITLNAASTVEYNGSTAQAITNAITYGNLKYSGSNTATLAGSTTVAGSYTQTSGTVVVGNLNSAVAFDITGNFSLSGAATFTLLANTGASASATVTVTGNTTLATTGTTGIILESVNNTNASGKGIFQTTDLTITSAGTSTRLIDFGASTITENEFRIKGNFSKAASSGTFWTSSSGSAVGIVFNKSGTQTFSYAGTNSSYTQYVVNSGSTLQLLTNLTMDAGTNPLSTFIVNGTLEMGANVISGTTNPTFTLNSGATLITSNPISTAITVPGTKTFSSGANYEFKGASTGTFTTTPTASTVNNLTINNASGVTLSQALSVAGNLTLTAGVLTTTASNLLTVTNPLNGAISGSATSYIDGPVTRVLGATSTGTYTVPLGKAGKYYPFAYTVGTITGSPTINLEAFATGVGSADGTTLTATSGNEYWKVVTTGTFSATSFSVGRSTPVIGSLNVIGSSTSNGATSYSSIGGSPGTLSGQTASILTSSSGLSGAATIYLTMAQKKTYTLTYNGNSSDNDANAPVDGSSPYNYNASVTVLSPGSLTKTGFNFNGWNTVANGSGQSYTPSQTFLITANTTLYAQWLNNSFYPVTYNSNGGTGTLTDPSSPYSPGSNVTVLTNTFTRAGYTFAGWNTASDGSGTNYSEGGTISDIQGAVVLYAKWTANNNTITFNANGGTGTMADQTIATAASANLTTNAFTRAGYTFAGWATTAGGAVAYADGANYTMGTASVTLYAKWTANTNTITFDGNTNTGGSTASQNIATDASANLTANGYTKTGYTFAGWATTAGGAVAYANQASYTMGTANVTLYAKWTANNNTITFNANGGTGTMANQTIATDASANLTANAFTRAGYTFAGWNTLANGTGTSYTNQASYTMGTASVTLYAQWTANINTITFDGNTSTGGSTASQNIATGASANLTANGFTKTGYTFAGWATTAGGTVAYANQASYTMGTGNVTLYAKWTANNNTITFNSNGGTGTMANQTIATDASANLTANAFTRSGYIFGGWATTANGAVAYADGASYTMGTANVTLYAQWVQVIARQDFEASPATPTWGYSINDLSGTVGGVTYAAVGVGSGISSGTSSQIATSAPANANLFTGGTQGYRMQGANGAIGCRQLVFTGLNTSLYKNIQMSFRIAGMSIGSNANGVDNGTGTTLLGAATPVDFALVEFSTDGGTTWYKQAVVSATGGSNVRWSFDATGSGSRAYAANDTYSSFNTTGTGTITSGTTAITTATITGLPSATSLQMRISLEADASNESWIIDDVNLFGTTAYSVTYSANGGSGTPPVDNSSPYLQGASVTVKANTDLTRTGYTFSGWNTASDGTGTNYNATGSDNFVIGAANVTLYAKWTINSYSVSYDGNGNTGGTAPASANYNYNSTVTVAALGDLVKTGSSFTGWNTAANGSGTAYAPGATFPATANVTLYAQWLADNYNAITYNSNGGSGTLTDPNSPYIDGATVTVLANTFTRTGYTFSGWNTAANGSGTSYAAGNTFTSAADVTLYAQWTINSYTVTYDANGGTGTLTDPASPYTYNTTVTVLNNTFTRTHYSFTGWNTAANGSGTSYAEGATFSAAADVTLYAQWSIITYTVTYNNNGGTGTLTDPASPYNSGTTVTVLANTFTRFGYTFNEWNTAANGSGTSYAEGATFSAAADVTLYAQWTINTYTVTYDGNTNTSGTAPTDGNSPYDYNEVVTVLNNTGSLLKTGYIFSGWNTQADGLGTTYPAGTGTFNISADITLYALWQPPSLLRWNTFGNAGTENSEPSVFNNTNIASASITIGSITPGANGNRLGGSAWSTSTLAVAVSGNDYMQFIVTPNTGYNFTPTNFDFSWQSSGTGPTSVTLRSSADGFTADLGTVTVSSSIAPYSISISGLTGLTTATTFRLYGYGASSSAGTGGFDVATNAVNVELFGTTATNSYTVTYNGNTNTGGTVPVDGNSPYDYNTSVTVLGAGTLTKTGSTFIGWNTAANGSGTSYAVGATFAATANVTLYAQWCSGNTYTGTNSDFNNNANWSCGVAPSSGSSAGIVINSGTGRTTLNADYDVKDGSFVYNGGAAGDTLIIAPGVRLEATGTGSINFNGHPVLIRSNAAGTGSIGQVSSLSGGTNVTAERYIRQNTYRGWRLLSIPFQTSGTQTIRQSWQEGATTYAANPHPGYGTRITANTPTAIADGYDAQTFGNSLLTYNGTAWIGHTSGTGNSVSRGTAGDAWMIYIRGDRTVDTAQAITTPTETILRAKGALYTSYPEVTIPANTNGLIGNVAPSEINFLNLNKGGGADDAFYVWDPQLYGSYGLGAYQTFSANTPIPWKPVPGGGSYGTTPNTKIQSGMGFFVHATNTDGTIQLTEASKSSGKNVNGTGFRPTAPASVVPYIETNLYAAVTGGNYSLADGNIVGFDDSYNNDIDNKDNIKVQGFGDGIGMVRGTSVLSAEQRRRIVSGDIIPYRMTNLKKQAYKLEIIPSSLNDGLTTAVLEDKYLNTATPISLDAPTTRVFNADPAVQASFYERFRVVFSRPTPVTIINVSAEQKAQGMEIGWKTGVENGVKQYEVERSADGNNFTKAGTLPATANNGAGAAYSFMDVSPLPGVNYYRIKTVDLSGAVMYSYVIKVVNGNGVTPAITLNTTVITDNRISLQFINQPKGKYGIRLSNAIGQQLMKESVQHNGGNSTQSFTVPSLVSKGIYHLEIVKPNGSKQVEKVVVN